MRSYLQRITTVSFMGIFLVGCATPQHTNTLIFGTNTKFALDISQSPTNLPSITFGYKREEAVWMPLLANVDKDGKPCNLSPNTNKSTNEVSQVNSDCLFQGNDDKDKDTYSVLASFGAKFRGEAVGYSTPSAKGGGALGQFFATGIAARELAKRDGAKLFTIHPELEVSEEIKQAAIEGLKQEYIQIDQIINFINDGNGKVSNPKIQSLTSGNNLEHLDRFSGKSITEFRDELNGPSRRSVNTLLKRINLGAN